jgi:hypothetical protein
MIRTTANASPNLVPIFKFPRNIVFSSVLAQSARAARAAPLRKASFWRSWPQSGVFFIDYACMRLRVPPD